MEFDEYGRPPTNKGDAKDVFPFNRKLLQPPKVFVLIQWTEQPWEGWDFDQYLVWEGEPGANPE
jgi:hypothetical protein